MKLPNEVVESIRQSVSAVLAANPDAAERYRKRDIPRVRGGMDINMRFRWDVLYASGFKTSELYSQYDCNDSHIDTALRKCIPDIE